MQTTGILSSLLFDNQNITNVIIIDIVCVLAAILVVINKNPIISVLFLITLFLGIACHLILGGLTFIGLSYLLVYVGAISILFLFILMLINIRVSELATETQNTISLGLVVTLVFNYIMIKLLGPINMTRPLDKPSLVSANVWENSLWEVTNISNLGDIMYTNYSIWLIITSLILLLSMIGAIVITIKKPR